METQAVEFINTFGTASIFIYAIVYLMKKRDEQEKRREMETAEREARFAQRLGDTEHFIRQEMTLAITKSADAMNNVATSIDRMPCRALREIDIQRIVDDTNSRINRSQS